MSQINSAKNADIHPSDNKTCLIRVYLARHGQTDWNKNKRFQSRNDIPLNETGLQQARDLQKLFTEKGLQFDYVYSSPLKRALVTAGILSGRGTGGDVVTDERLLEIDMGEYESRFEADLEAEFGDTFRAWRDVIFLDEAPGGESLKNACKRAESFLQDMLKQVQSARSDKNGDVNVLLVGHQGINLALQTVFSGQQQPPYNLSLHQYKQHNDQVNVWQVVDASAQTMQWTEQIKLG